MIRKWNRKINSMSKLWEQTAGKSDLNFYSMGALEAHEGLIERIDSRKDNWSKPRHSSDLNCPQKWIYCLLSSVLLTSSFEASFENLNKQRYHWQTKQNYRICVTELRLITNYDYQLLLNSALLIVIIYSHIIINHLFSRRSMGNLCNGNYNRKKNISLKRESKRLHRCDS